MPKFVERPRLNLNEVDALLRRALESHDRQERLQIIGQLDRPEVLEALPVMDRYRVSYGIGEVANTLIREDYRQAAD